METIILILFGIIATILFAYISFTYDPTKEWEKRGTEDALRIYQETKVIPVCPSAESLIKQNYTAEFIKHYIVGFRRGIHQTVQNQSYSDEK